MDVIGDYHMVKYLGENDFSSMYLAKHPLMQKNYLLQVLSEDLMNDEDFVQRFQEEVHALAKLDHPSLLKIHTISQDGGKFFLVMDPIADGIENIVHLERYLDLKGNVLTETEIETILLSVASTLDYAHTMSRGKEPWIHGSLKLTNILIDQNSQGKKVFLANFGLTHLLGEGRCLLSSYQKLALSMAQSSKDADYKTYLSYIRDFFFLAPEQKACLQNCSFAGKVDVYAFGVLTYYLLTKQFPEGIIEPIASLQPDMQLSWDLVIRCFLDKNPVKRPVYIAKSMETLLRKKTESQDLYAWKDIEKKVEDKMQLSFSFDKPDVETSSSYFAFPKAHTLKPIIKPPSINRPTYEPDPGAIFQKELSVSRYEPTKVEIKEVEPIFTQMVVIPGGTYFRGSNTGARDETPKHAVTIDSFAIDIHPVTNEQFIRFLTAMGGEKDGSNNDILRLRDSRIKRVGGRLSVESGYNKHPVVGITWYGAVAYAKWVGKRLPTEAEWEIAASGGKDSGMYTTGDHIERNQANFFSSDTTAVMSYPPGFFSLYDMAGNVYEWCEDWYAYNYYDVSMHEPENPKGPPQGVYRVLRGGCWKSLKEDLRFSHRHRNNPGTVNRTYGFRCAADVH